MAFLRIRATVVLAWFLMIGCFWSGSAVLGAGSERQTLEKLQGEMLRLIEQLEQRQPQEQAITFKLRELLACLMAAKATLRDGQPLGVHGTRSPAVPSNVDPMLLGEHGTDMYASCQNLYGDNLRTMLRTICEVQVPVGYQTAQDVVFSKLDNHDGEVECVYTGRRLATNGEPPADNMNIEHTWPQSQGATGVAKSDLHHLFPTDSKANSIRSSWPFGNVTRPTWEQGGSRFDGRVFEVRKAHRGNVARAKFYFAVRYLKSIPPEEEAVLREWANQDPVDEAERRRNDRIENIQHNRNPFVDRPDFIDRIKDF